MAARRYSVQQLVPITISIPQGPTFGPGVPYVVSSDFIGPLPSGSFFDFRITRDADGLEECWSWAIFVSGKTYSSVAFADPVQPVSATNQFTLRNGDTGYFRTTLNSPTSVLDSGTLQVTWDTTTGLGLQAERLVRQPVEGGFTADDRAVLMSVNQATMAELPTQGGVPGIAQLLLSSLVGGPPDQLLRRGETVFLTGDGSVDRPSGSGQVQAYGAIWDFAEVPPGFGFARGQVLEYDRRMAQFVVIRFDAQSNEFVDQVVDVRSNFGQLRFPVFNTRGVRYSIAPGVVVAWTWLIFVVGQ